MPTLLLRFPGRRYHATPWGHHVNEGLVEWPPSPWRLLRALLAVGYTRLGWDAALNEPWRSTPPSTARSLIAKLSSVMPAYALPPAVGTHSRHYMPVAKFDKGREGTTLVFDTWAQIDQGELAITWDANLDDGEIALFGQLAGHLNYLGRSESWVCARLATSDEARAIDHNCRSCDESPSAGPGWEQVGLLAPEHEAAFRAWRANRLGEVEARLPPIPLPEKKKLTAKDRKPTEQREAERQRAFLPYPDDLIACLQTDTAWLREHGWSQPPGSRRVLYWRRTDALQAQPPAPRSATADAAAAPFALLALASGTNNLHALPTLARSLPQGEMLHRQMVAARLRLAPDRAPVVLSGCDEAGRPLRGRHGHAHVLSLDLDGDGHIDHMLVWAPDGLDVLDRQALRMTRGAYTKGGIGNLRLAWAGAGGIDEMLGLPGSLGAGLARSLGAARVWTSATPFVPPRHLKPRGPNSLEGQIRAELRSRGLPMTDAVELLAPQRHQQARTLRHHVRVRRLGAAPPVNVGFALRLSFADPVAGPLCLGYGSHFGLGRFEHAPATEHIAES